MNHLHCINAALLKIALVTNELAKQTDPLANNPQFHPNNPQPMLGSDKSHLTELLDDKNESTPKSMETPQSTNSPTTAKPQNYFQPPTTPLYPR